MRQRLGIARALVNDPVVVFLDEPTLGLDPAGQREVLDLVRTIAATKGTTVVLSSHTLPEIEEVCTTVLILDRGRVIASGTVAEVTDTQTVRRSGRLRVPVAEVGRARAVLAALPGVTVLADERPDVVLLAMADESAAGPNSVLAAVLDTGIPVLSFEVEGARLSDAFLTMTRQVTP
jgi:ABC-2 type transport system ATP-binding protein